MSIIYKKGDLFQDPNLKDYTIVHACNAQGVWGSGFAKQCADKYPIAYLDYQRQCEIAEVGECLTTNTKQAQFIMCLLTSHDYGKNKDSIWKILSQTEDALKELFANTNSSDKFISPKINAGLFEVPWEYTERLINEFLSKYNNTWVVYDNN